MADLFMKRLIVPLALFAVIVILGFIFLSPGEQRQQNALTIISNDRLTNVFMSQVYAMDHEASDNKAVTINEQSTSSCVGQTLDQPQYVISVPVATLWSAPDNARTIDMPGLTQSADIRIWLSALDIPRKLWFVGKLETQALLGTKVNILETRGGWVKVAIPDQAAPQYTDGYPGWLPIEQIVEQYAGYDHCVSAVVSSPTAWLYKEATGLEPYQEISFMTRLPVVAQDGNWVTVLTPANELKWISVQEVRIDEPADRLRLSAIDSEDSAVPAWQAAATGDELVATAERFLDLPYLWSGMSGFGFDCSGFVYTLYKYHGITLSRDAKDQAAAGMAVKSDELQPGDLLFYAFKKGKGKVHHVAMYIGNGQMIHSPKTERAVEIIPMQTREYAVEFAGARRYIGYDSH